MNFTRFRSKTDDDIRELNLQLEQSVNALVTQLEEHERVADEHQTQIHSLDDAMPLPEMW